MNQDIGDLLNDWPFDPNEFTARRIAAKDGSEKLQIRMDLGIMQLEVEGRPDGQRPEGFSSLLEFCENTRDEASNSDNDEFVLNESECEDLFQEAWQYYHRYLSLFYLEDYSGVVRDTDHILNIFSLVQEFADNDEVKWYFDQYYAHAIMMQTRAKAMAALADSDYPNALSEIESGIGDLERYVEDWEGDVMEEDLPELSFLRDWQEELEQKRPLSKREQLERDLNVAVESENFEEAARLRDKISTTWPHGPRRHFRPER